MIPRQQYSSATTIPAPLPPPATTHTQSPITAPDTPPGVIPHTRPALTGFCDVLHGGGHVVVPLGLLGQLGPLHQLVLVRRHDFCQTEEQEQLSHVSTHIQC